MLLHLMIYDVSLGLLCIVMLKKKMEEYRETSENLTCRIFFLKIKTKKMILFFFFFAKMIFINTETIQRETMELLLIASIRCANELNLLPLFMAVIPRLLRFCVDLIGAYVSSISTTGAQLYYERFAEQRRFCVAREVWQVSLMFYKFSIFLV